MSGAQAQEVVRSAVPVAASSALDLARRAPDGALEEALRKVRPADVGRDLSRRPLEEGRRFVEASDPRRAAAMLRAAHPLDAGRLLAHCKTKHVATILSFLPTDH